MANLFISYDLNSPSQNYEKLFTQIKSLTYFAKIQKSLWYVNTHYAAKDVLEHLWKVMDPNDNLCVIDTTNNNIHQKNLTPESWKYICQLWNKVPVS